jgi:hypothetical protein
VIARNVIALCINSTPKMAKVMEVLQVSDVSTSLMMPEICRDAKLELQM